MESTNIDERVVNQVNTSSGSKSGFLENNAAIVHRWLDVLLKASLTRYPQQEASRDTTSGAPPKSTEAEMAFASAGTRQN